MNHRFIIGQFEDTIPNSLENFSPGPGGLSVEETATTLDGMQVESGVFGTYVETEREEVQVIGDAAEWVQESYTETVGCNFLFDPEVGTIYGDSSAIEYLFDELTAAGTPIARVAVDCGQWARDLGQSDDGYVWMRGWREGDDDDPDDVGVEYHMVTQSSRGEDTNQLGWGYERDGMYYRGYAAASGYVALYRPNERPIDHLAAWLREDILEYTHFQYEEQATLTDVETCDECGREPDRGLEEVDDRELCIVCADRELERKEVSA